MDTAQAERNSTSVSFRIGSQIWTNIPDDTAHPPNSHTLNSFKMGEKNMRQACRHYRGMTERWFQREWIKRTCSNRGWWGRLKRHFKNDGTNLGHETSAGIGTFICYSALAFLQGVGVGVEVMSFERQWSHENGLARQAPQADISSWLNAMRVQMWNVCRAMVRSLILCCSMQTRRTTGITTKKGWTCSLLEV